MKSKPTNHGLGQTAWDAYAKSVGGKAFNGDLLPTWEEMKNDPKKAHLVNAWIASAAAVCDVVCDHIVTIIDSAKERDAPSIETTPKAQRKIDSTLRALANPTDCCGAKALIRAPKGYRCPCGNTFEPL